MGTCVRSRLARLWRLARMVPLPAPCEPRGRVRSVLPGCMEKVYAWVEKDWRQALAVALIEVRANSISVYEDVSCSGAPLQPAT